MYAQDYDETLPAQEPCHRVAPADWLYGYGWISDKIQPYVKNDQIFTCPSASNQPVAYYFAGRPFGGCQTASTDATHNRSLSVYDAPATSVMMTDGDWDAGNARPHMLRVLTASWSTWNVGGNCCERPTCRHNDGANALYADGHCKWNKRDW